MTITCQIELVPSFQTFIARCVVMLITLVEVLSTNYGFQAFFQVHVKWVLSINHIG